MPNIERPFVSPLGVPGAAFALIICCVTLIGLFFSDPVYRRVVIGAAVWFALGIAYFGLYGRHHLVRAPEEDFALKMNEND